MMHFLGSLGSPMGSPAFRPREAFHLLRDSSFWSVILKLRGQSKNQERGVRIREESPDLPSFVYSSIVFFSPTLKPSVLVAVRSSSWSAIVAVSGAGALYVGKQFIGGCLGFVSRFKVVCVL